MSEALFEKIIGLVNKNFEWLVYVNGSLLALFLLVIIAVKLRDVSIPKLLHSTMRNVLFMAIVVGQIALVALFGYLYWENYQRPAPELQVIEDVSASTQWVKDDIKIYFIDGNTLRSITIDDRKSEDVFLGDDPIKEYHFSPDGRYLVILTQKDLFLLSRETKKSQRIDTLGHSAAEGEEEGQEVTRGSISDIRWAPDSQKFVYEIARWSKFAAQDSVYIYSLKDQKKKAVRSPARRISSLHWDRQSDNLYYLHHEARDTSLHSTAFEVKVFRIPLATLVPELVTRIPFEEASVPIENLNLRDIDLFLEGDKLSFGRPGGEDYLASEDGVSLGIDDEDYLYFVSSEWFRKRLYKIPREPRTTDVPRYQYRGGDLVIDHIRWIPGGRYVIMEHKYWGVLILEPSTGKTGLLIRAHGHTFGWYRELKA